MPERVPGPQRHGLDGDDDADRRRVVAAGDHYYERRPVPDHDEGLCR